MTKIYTIKINGKRVLVKEIQEHIARMITDFSEESFKFDEDGEMTIEDTDYYITIFKKE